MFHKDEHGNEVSSIPVGVVDIERERYLSKLRGMVGGGQSGEFDFLEEGEQGLYTFSLGLYSCYYLLF